MKRPKSENATDVNFSGIDEPVGWFVIIELMTKKVLPGGSNKKSWGNCEAAESQYPARSGRVLQIIRQSRRRDESNQKAAKLNLPSLTRLELSKIRISNSKEEELTNYPTSKMDKARSLKATNDIAWGASAGAETPGMIRPFLATLKASNI